MQSMSASNPDLITKRITTTTTTVSTTTTTQVAEASRFDNLRGSAGTRSRGVPAGADDAWFRRGDATGDWEPAGKEPFATSFGVPRTIVPKDVAKRFPSASGYFPTTLQRDQAIPIEEEERTRFDVLRARRAALEPYDESRHADAEARRFDLIRGQQRALHEMDEQRKAKAARATANGTRGANIPTSADGLPLSQAWSPAKDRSIAGAGRGDALLYDVPSEVVPAENAAGFPHTRRYFDAKGLDSYNSEWRALPLSEEEQIRFAPLAARRNWVAIAEVQQHRDVNRRREEATESLVAALREKDVERARRASTADRTNSSLPRGAPIPNDGEFPEPGAKSFVFVSDTPEEVRCSEVERHFRNAAAAMAEHGGPNPNAGWTVPLAEEERARFSRVAARRDGEAARHAAQHERAEANRAEQLEGRVLALKAYDTRRDAVQRRLREKTGALDTANKERMQTAEERRRAILEARVANLREIGAEREARGRQALDERRMAEHGFVPPHADVTVVAAKPVYAQRSMPAAYAPIAVAHVPAVTAAPAVMSTAHRSDTAAPSVVDVDVNILSTSGPSRVRIHTNGEEPTEVIVHPTLAAREAETKAAETQPRQAHEARAIAAADPAAPIAAPEAVVSSSAPRSAEAQAVPANKSRALVNEPAPRDKKAKSSRFCC